MDFQHSVDQNYVNGRTVTLDYLYFQDGTFEYILLSELLTFGGLAHAAKLEDQI